MRTLFNVGALVGAGLPDMTISLAKMMLAEPPLSPASRRLQGFGEKWNCTLTVTKSAKIHLGKRPFSICNRTLSFQLLRDSAVLEPAFNEPHAYRGPQQFHFFI
ncbi:hypothetical protein ACYZT4_15620 [Pseudomonas sp. GB2N2]